MVDDKEIKIKIAKILMRNDPELRRFIHGATINEIFVLIEEEVDKARDEESEAREFDRY